MRTTTLLFLLCLAAAPARAQDLRLDILIRGGQVIDGTGSNSRRDDVGIAGDRIVFVGDAAKRGLFAARVIDADGLIVAPGFIDPHTHSDQELLNPKLSHNQPYLYQGITTVFTGNDGAGPWPIAKTIDDWQRHGVGTNVALFVGQGTVRGAVMGMTDADPSAEQLERMRLMVKQGMQEGAFGMSTGLFYAPGIFSKTGEIIELARVVAAHGGIYDTHMRSESSAGIGLIGAIEETIRIGREAKLPVHISHIKALGADVWGQSKQAIEIIRKARSEGIAVTANQYPYIASATALHAALVPPWAQAGGQKELLRRMDDPQERPKLIADMERLLKVRGGPEAILFRRAGTVPPELAGKTLGAVAKETGKPPVEAALDVIRRVAVLPIISFNMNEEDVEAYMREEWVMTGSDGTFGHPRTFGTFPRKIREYVLKRKVLTLPAAIRSSTSLTAETFGLAERGTIRERFFADIVVFDEAAIADRATYLEPAVLSTGIRYVLVNGKIAIDAGEYNGALAGRMLRKVSGTSR
jgi:N-acyl-D-aspartate/D-glutamate deacylase